jgi:hypothetical protein
MYDKIIVIVIAVFALYVLYPKVEEPKLTKTSITKSIVKKKFTTVKEKLNNSPLIQEGKKRTKGFFSKLSRQIKAHKEARKNRLEIKRISND